MYASNTARLLATSTLLLTSSLGAAVGCSSQSGRTDGSLVDAAALGDGVVDVRGIDLDQRDGMNIDLITADGPLSDARVSDTSVIVDQRVVIDTLLVDAAAADAAPADAAAVDGALADGALACPSSPPSGQICQHPRGTRCVYAALTCDCVHVCSGAPPPPGRENAWVCLQSNDPACPAGLPQKGTSCSQPLTCRYPTCPIATARCDAGGWLIFQGPPPP